MNLPLNSKAKVSWTNRCTTSCEPDKFSHRKAQTGACGQFSRESPVYSKIRDP